LGKVYICHQNAKVTVPINTLQGEKNSDKKDPIKQSVRAHVYIDRIAHSALRCKEERKKERRIKPILVLTTRKLNVFQDRSEYKLVRKEKVLFSKKDRSEFLIIEKCVCVCMRVYLDSPAMPKKKKKREKYLI